MQIETTLIHTNFVFNLKIHFNVMISFKTTLKVDITETVLLYLNLNLHLQDNRTNGNERQKWHCIKNNCVIT